MSDALGKKFAEENERSGHHVHTQSDMNSHIASSNERREAHLAARVEKAHEEVEHAKQVDRDMEAKEAREVSKSGEKYQQMEREHEMAEKQRAEILEQKKMKAHAEVEHAKQVAAQHKHHQK
ncbi:hypothetical protein GQ42DRAFT_181445 [Ramicandelaber brevisporus]|nr:hypothetical protein GQ42DRAFT_181445 [Ramicandelaber brevisporus]